MKTPLAGLAFLLTTLTLPACAQSTAELGEAELSGQPGFQARPPLPGSDLFQGERDQANRFYSEGALLNADLLPAEGFGFVKIHRPRQRGYASFDLVEVLKDASARLQSAFPSRDRIMVGDMSSEHGGFLSGHASHQNGLDADVAFIRVNQTEQDPDDTTGFQESFVKNNRLTANFDMVRNWNLAKILIETGRVQRLFVNAVVKRGICAHAKETNELVSQRETLKRLRVISGHTDHFHVRVTCPRSSPNCVPQEDMDDETGC